MAGIRVRNLTKAWGAIRAVDDIGFATGSPEFVTLLGPSGCGKSTTLRLIAGLETPTSGHIEIGGRDVTDMPASRRNLSMVFQSYALFPHLDVADNILFGLSIRGVAKAEQAQRLAEVSDPVCLLDEPLSNLDAQLRAEMRNEIRGLQQRLGITMLFVTHDQTEAMSMSDRIILMRDGRIEQSGTPAELYERPATSFVARFVGTPPMNVLDLAPGAGGLVVAGSEGPVVAPIPAGAPPRLGIRPEHVAFAADGLKAVVRSAEYFGADTITTCVLGAQSLLVRPPGRPTLAAGTTAHLSWGKRDAHLFDGGSGARLGPAP